VCLRKPGDSVTAGEPVLELHVDDESRLPGALAALEGAIAVGPEPPDPRPLVIERIS
jgi:thymidine phosphorylase